MFEIGDTVETVYGIGVIDYMANYSVGVYYDVRLENGQLVKVFENELEAVNV